MAARRAPPPERKPILIREDARRILGLVELDRALYTSAELELADAQRPRTRADCIDGPRPCPWYVCRHHLGIRVDSSTGSIVYRELEHLRESCDLDADEPLSLAELGEELGVKQERARQLQVDAFSSFRRRWKKGNP